MNWKQKILRILLLLLMGAGVTGLVALTTINARAHDETICENVDIQIDRTHDVYFIDQEDIKTLLLQTFGDSVKGDHIRQIEVGRIEKVIEKDPYVDDAETWVDANGELHIHIVQKQPLARVINRYGVNYYINENAEKIPISDKFTSRVPVVTGSIEEGTSNSDMIETPVLKNVLTLTRYIHSNTFWNAQIEQVAVADNGTFELIPKLGDHVIEFGSISNMEEKFNKLEIFYREGLNYVGWDKYAKIKLDFDGQVVCEKKINYEQQ